MSCNGDLASLDCLLRLSRSSLVKLVIVEICDIDLLFSFSHFFFSSFFRPHTFYFKQRVPSSTQDILSHLLSSPSFKHNLRFNSYPQENILVNLNDTKTSLISAFRLTYLTSTSKPRHPNSLPAPPSSDQMESKNQILWEKK